MSLGNFHNVAFVFIATLLMAGIVFPLLVFWSRWDLERINNRNIKYSRKLNDSDRWRLNQGYDFLSPGDLAKFNKDGFPGDGIPLLITQTLSQDEMKDQPRMIYDFFCNKGSNKLVFTLGFGAPGEDMYKPRKIKLDNLSKVLADSISRGKFRLGSNDLYIEDDNKKFRFTLCHESDVHFSSKDLSVLEEVEAIWMEMNLRVRLAYEQND